jgi:hypothetical protein
MLKKLGTEVGVDCMQFADIYRRVRLEEQQYNARKIYYHVSPEQFSKFEKRNGFRKNDKDANSGGVFLTPSLHMIEEYIEFLAGRPKSKRDNYYIYQCMLTRSPYIFNPSFKDDLRKLVAEIEKDPTSFIDEYVTTNFNYQPDSIGAIIKNLRRHMWDNMENPAITKRVRLAGFEGYVSDENDVGNVFVFNPELVKILNGKPWHVYETKKGQHNWEDWNIFEELHTNVSRGFGDLDRSIYGHLDNYGVDARFAIRFSEYDDDLNHMDDRKIDLTNYLSRQAKVKPELKELLVKDRFFKEYDHATFRGKRYTNLKDLLAALDQDFGFGDDPSPWDKEDSPGEWDD